jgi:uncharacterized protein (TIGR02145 family)
MKLSNTLLPFCLLFLGLTSNAQVVRIGTNTPATSSQLEVNSTTKGFLPPRMTSAQRNTIVSPAIGSVIFNTTTNCLNFYNGSGWNEACGTPIIKYPSGSIFCASGATEIVNVTNPKTGKIWMDRNLGASQVATSSIDTNSYGDLYQWGRGADGHHCRNSGTTTTLSSTDILGNSGFINASTTPYDWRSGQNGNLWQGVNGTNNPCPIGYRLPTETEWDNERLSWVLAPISSTNTSAGAFASPLKLPMAGYRNFNLGSLSNVGTNGVYWSSTVRSTSSRGLGFNTGNAYIFTVYRANGFSVRCLKD